MLFTGGEQWEGAGVRMFGDGNRAAPGIRTYFITWVICQYGSAHGGAHSGLHGQEQEERGGLTSVSIRRRGLLMVAVGQ